MWNNKCIKLKIVIPPAPWATWWAIMIYIILISGFIYWLLRLYINYKIDNEKFKMSEETLQKERELNQAKINFFENISHELRTPLGLIYGPFCELSKEKGFSDKTKKYMSLMGANIERLMSLVEQILNFSHLNSETMSLAVDKVEVIAFVRKIMKRFEGENEEKHIKITFSPPVEELEMLVDQDKMDKILSNLLSNAFKYTPSGGNIFLSLSILSAQEIQKDYSQEEFVASKYVQFSIKDSGIGVPKEELNRIFDRFYRSKSKSNVSIVGSGIGLYYIKCLTLKHKGFIRAILNADKGMTFMFCLPLDAIYSTSEMQKRPSNLWVGNREIDKIIIADSIQSDDERNEDNKGIKEKPQLLIIEDEPNLQDFLYNLLKPYYCIERAYDGSEGLKKALESIPDIILADVMMPVMNGYELCEKIKRDLHTCHIPVILLTAKSNIDEQIEGINAGADVYISKPFNPDYLISVLQGTILNRKRMQHIITDVRSAALKTSESKNHLSKMDEELLQKLDNRIEAELANPELSIDVLSSELNFSRSTFYRKIKSLTGLSPNDYIRVYKVKRAAQLIESGNYFLSEIGDMTGFSTQSYFSAIFKKHYGMTPTEYKNLKFNKE
jgi:signal transduction histidine kinase/DNA-binding response OmpR family regulator